MEKFEGVVKFVNEYHFTTYYGYRLVDNYIYKFEDGTGKVYVWKTTNILMVEGKEIGGLTPSSEIFPTKGSVVKIKASIKGEGEYKGEKQTLLTRVKLLEIVERQLTKEERDELKAQEQMESLKDGDFVWNMPYKQYKSHYADCETVAGSFKEGNYGRRVYTPSTISVIIREGRLKNSGVRGEHYSGYRFINEKGEHVTYRAVSVDNAEKRVNKDYPNHEWTLDKVYEYHTDPIW